MKNLSKSNHQWPLYVLPFLGGVFYTAGFPSIFSINNTFTLGPILGLILLFTQISSNIFLDRNNYKREFLQLFLFSMGINICGYHWIIQTLQEFGAINPPLNYILWVLFSFLIFPHLFAFWTTLGLLRLVLKKITHFNLNKKENINLNSILNSASLKHLSLATLLTLLEQITPQLFPGLAGGPFINLPSVLGLAPILGIAGYSFISYLIVFSIVSYIKEKQKDWYSLLMIIPSYFILSYFITLNSSQFTENPTNNGQLPKQLNVRIVQNNIGNFLKVSSEKGDQYSTREVLAGLLKLSTENLPSNTHLILWPETSYPYSIQEDTIEHQNVSLGWPLSEIIEQTNSNLVFGGYVRKNENFPQNYFEDVYNSVIHINSNGKLQDFYHKHLLLSFGETLPFGPLNQWIGKYIDNISFFARGEKFTLFHLDQQFYFTSAVCYELLYGEFMRDMFNQTKIRPEFIINVTNDSWFGDTVEPYQHLYLSRWRAVELNVPILRATNTGISSVINKKGQLQFSSELFKAMYIDQKISIVKSEKTLYQSGGFYNILIIALFLINIRIVFELRRRKI